tara:strand:+ start:2394 stop:2888 length:495 start_codon:yes stop_codon:yes gene_type:complete
MRLKTATLGYPRMGEFRELKKAVEAYWKGEISETELNDVAKVIRKRNWQHQKDNGIAYIPSNDFSFYDQILDLSCALGNVPERFNYPNEVGPGVYDIHSPRVPTQENMTNLIKKAVELLPIKNIWVNPDCGLKTRGWPETKAALTHMVASAKELREAFKEVSVN